MNANIYSTKDGGASIQVSSKAETVSYRNVIMEEAR